MKAKIGKIEHKIIVHDNLAPCKVRYKGLVKLYAPMACFTIFGIFQEYSMEYSIFRNFVYFECFTILKVYSANIPYSADFNIFHVPVFLEYSIIPKFDKVSYRDKIWEYSIFHKISKIKLLKARNGLLKRHSWL